VGDWPPESVEPVQASCTVEEPAVVLALTPLGASSVPALAAPGPPPATVQ